MAPSLKLLSCHTYYLFLELIRQPMYVISTLVFPAMFFWFFGVPNAQNKDAAALLVGSFSCFAALGVVLFQFAIGIAQDKTSPWAHYLRVLPLPISLTLLPRLLNGIFVSTLAVLGVVMVGLTCTPLSWQELPWGPFALSMATGSLPFALMGMTLGYAANPTSIVPLANLIYLPLSFAGGLWLPPTSLPKAVQAISEFLPSRYFGEVVWASLLKKPLPYRETLGLCLYAAIFLVTAIWFFKRNQEQEFH